MEKPILSEGVETIIANTDFAKQELKTLEQAVELHLLTLNRHERRAWLAKRSRKAGKQRQHALTLKSDTTHKRQQLEAAK